MNNIIGTTHQVSTAPPVNIISVIFIDNSIATIEIKLIPNAVFKAILNSICLARIMVSKIMEVNSPFANARPIISNVGQL